MVNLEDIYELTLEAMEDFKNSDSKDIDLINAMKLCEIYWNEGQKIKSPTKDFSKNEKSSKFFCLKF